MNTRLDVRAFAIGGAALVLVAGFWLARMRATAETAPDDTPKQASAPGDSHPRPVEVVKPQRLGMHRILDVPATIEAFETADLYARVSGYVREVLVDIGDAVKAGDALAVLDIPEMADELRQAESVLGAREARLAQARSMVQTARAELDRYLAEEALKRITFERKKELRAANAIPDQELDQAKGEHAVSEAQVRVGAARLAGVEADVKVAEAEVGMARAAVSRHRTLMEYATIRAPFDGIVSRRLVDRGALVPSSPGNQAAPMFTVQRIDHLRVFIDAPEIDVPHIRSGIEAQVTPHGMNGKSFAGKVARIASSLNPATRTMRTEIDIPNPEGLLMHGMYAQVVLKLDERPNALTIPAAAILTEGTRPFVYAVRDGRAVRTEIQVGLDDGVRIEVLRGLGDETPVVLAGKGLVSDGAPVRPAWKAAGL